MAVAERYLIVYYIIVKLSDKIVKKMLQAGQAASDFTERFK